VTSAHFGKSQGWGDGDSDMTELGGLALDQQACVGAELAVQAYWHVNKGQNGSGNMWWAQGEGLGCR